ncbi:MAG: phosphoenolpyruvate-utilizing N-terminal domain-containing protein, partial [Treponema sp.]
MNVILGISAAGGIGIGSAFVVPEEKERVIPKNKITLEKTTAGWKRFEKAVDKIQAQISKNLEKLDAKSLQRVIFETYQLMLADPVFLAEVKKSFEQNLYNIEYTLNEKVEEYADKLRNSGNEYLAERAQDIEDVFGRVLDELLNFHPFDIEEVPDGAVIVAKALKTSDTVILSKRKIAGLALTEGGVSSHVAILAKSYGIPAVVALGNITEQVHDGEQLIVDGKIGEVITSPDVTTLSEYNAKIKAEEAHLKALEKFRTKPGLTKDGQPFKILANIGTPEEADIAMEEGADGIGLFRTE